MIVLSRVTKTTKVYILASCECQMWNGEMVRRSAPSTPSPVPCTRRPMMYISGIVAVPNTADTTRTGASPVPTNWIQKWRNRV